MSNVKINAFQSLLQNIGDRTQPSQ